MKKLALVLFGLILFSSIAFAQANHYWDLDSKKTIIKDVQKGYAYRIIANENEYSPYWVSVDEIREKTVIISIGYANLLDKELKLKSVPGKEFVNFFNCGQKKSYSGQVTLSENDYSWTCDDEGNLFGSEITVQLVELASGVIDQYGVKTNHASLNVIYSEPEKVSFQSAIVPKIKEGNYKGKYLVEVTSENLAKPFKLEGLPVYFELPTSTRKELIFGFIPETAYTFSSPAIIPREELKILQEEEIKNSVEYLLEFEETVFDKINKPQIGEYGSPKAIADALVNNTEEAVTDSSSQTKLTLAEVLAKITIPKTVCGDKEVIEPPELKSCLKKVELKKATIEKVSAELIEKMKKIKLAGGRTIEAVEFNLDSIEVEIPADSVEEVLGELQEEEIVVQEDSVSYKFVFEEMPKPVGGRTMELVMAGAIITKSAEIKNLQIGLVNGKSCTENICQENQVPHIVFLPHNSLEINIKLNNYDETKPGFFSFGVKGKVVVPNTKEKLSYNSLYGEPLIPFTKIEESYSFMLPAGKGSEITIYDWDNTPFEFYVCQDKDGDNKCDLYYQNGKEFYGADFREPNFEAASIEVQPLKGVYLLDIKVPDYICTGEEEEEIQACLLKDLFPDKLIETVKEKIKEKIESFGRSIESIADSIQAEIPEESKDEVLEYFKEKFDLNYDGNKYTYSLEEDKFDFDKRELQLVFGVKREPITEFSDLQVIYVNGFACKDKEVSCETTANPYKMFLPEGFDEIEFYLSGVEEGIPTYFLIAKEGITEPGVDLEDLSNYVLAHQSEQVEWTEEDCLEVTPVTGELDLGIRFYDDFYFGQNIKLNFWDGTPVVLYVCQDKDGDGSCNLYYKDGKKRFAEGFKEPNSEAASITVVQSEPAVVKFELPERVKLCPEEDIPVPQCDLIPIEEKAEDKLKDELKEKVCGDYYCDIVIGEDNTLTYNVFVPEDIEVNLDDVIEVKGDSYFYEFTSEEDTTVILEPGKIPEEPIIITGEIKGDATTEKDYCKDCSSILECLACLDYRLVKGISK